MIPTRIAVRRTAAAVALASAATLLAACTGSSAPAATPTATVTRTATSGPPATAPGGSTAPATAPATATASAPGSSPAPSGHAGPGPCPTQSLSVKLGLGQGTAGSIYTVLEFRNVSQATCTLYGFPGVALAGGSPAAQIGLAAARSNGARRLVTLAPGAVASALLKIVEAGNYPPSKCGPKPSSSLQIYPPNQTRQVYVGYTSTACSKGIKIMTIGPVGPGSGGSA